MTVIKYIQMKAVVSTKTQKRQWSLCSIFKCKIDNYLHAWNTY